MEFLGTLPKGYLPAAETFILITYLHTHYISSILKASMALNMKHAIKKFL
jgi:hypothetical protein